MQEAIQLLKKYDNRKIPIKVLYYNLELLIKKEKKQIIDAYTTGAGYNCDEEVILANEYYNQNF